MEEENEDRRGEEENKKDPGLDFIQLGPIPCEGGRHHMNLGWHRCNRVFGTGICIFSSYRVVLAAVHFVGTKSQENR